MGKERRGRGRRKKMREGRKVCLLLNGGLVTLLSRAPALLNIDTNCCSILGTMGKFLRAVTYTCI